jgi:hypothetical protein
VSGSAAFPAALRRLRALASSALCLLATGCAISQPAVPLRQFIDGDLGAVRSFAAAQAAEGPAENLALVLNVQAQCDLLLGRFDEARAGFVRAGQIMGSWSTGSGEATGAILGSESSKTWKGDPYEKTMNAFYVAWVFLLHGEPDNARAACKRGILADAEVEDERYQADNALLFWLAGRMSRLMGSPDADDYFKEARQAHTFALEHGARGEANVPVLNEPHRGNVVVLAECGMGPEKYGDGGQDELARFRSRSHPAVRARVSLDGRPVGPTALLVDVDYQARTLGGTAMEGIRKGKAVFKSAATVAGIVLLDQAARAGRRHREAAQTQAIVGGALLLAGLLTSTAADVRHWPTLPSSVQALALDVPPGPHQLDVEFLDASGRSLPGLRQVRDIVVPPAGECWQLFRSLPIDGNPSPAP